MPSIYLSLGSNMGDRMANLDQAKKRLGEAIEILDISSYYETEPVDYLDQDLFLNQVLAGRTEMPPEELLLFTQSIETEMKRIKTIRFGPRNIDIDILLYGDMEYRSERLILPHPRMLERAFVMVPLFEIAPYLEISGFRIADVLVSHSVTGIRKVK